MSNINTKAPKIVNPVSINCRTLIKEQKKKNALHLEIHDFQKEKVDQKIKMLLLM